MKIKKDTLLRVKHNRKGEFLGRAMEDFDTEKEEFYPIIVVQIKSVVGMNTEATFFPTCLQNGPEQWFVTNPME